MVFSILGHRTKNLSSFVCIIVIQSTLVEFLVPAMAHSLFRQFVSEESNAILDEGDYLLLMGYSVLEATSKFLFATEPKPSVLEAPLFVSAART